MCALRRGLGLVVYPVECIRFNRTEVFIAERGIRVDRAGWGAMLLVPLGASLGRTKVLMSDPDSKQMKTRAADLDDPLPHE